MIILQLPRSKQRSFRLSSNSTVSTVEEYSLKNYNEELLPVGWLLHQVLAVWRTPDCISYTGGRQTLRPKASNSTKIHLKYHLKSQIDKPRVKRCENSKKYMKVEEPWTRQPYFAVLYNIIKLFFSLHIQFMLPEDVWVFIYDSLIVLLETGVSTTKFRIVRNYEWNSWLQTHKFFDWENLDQTLKHLHFTNWCEHYTRQPKWDLFVRTPHHFASHLFTHTHTHTVGSEHRLRVKLIEQGKINTPSTNKNPISLSSQSNCFG